jgi:hypothetical protein
MLLLLNFVGEPLDFSLVQVFELIFVLLVLPGKVILDVFILSLNQIEFMRLLLI